jgi:hypothetical protein
VVSDKFDFLHLANGKIKNYDPAPRDTQWENPINYAQNTYPIHQFDVDCDPSRPHNPAYLGESLGVGGSCFMVLLISRTFVKVSIMARVVSVAHGLLRMVASLYSPRSVNAFRLGEKLRFDRWSQFVTTLSLSSFVSSKICLVTGRGRLKKK